MQQQQQQQQQKQKQKQKQQQNENDETATRSRDTACKKRPGSASVRWRKVAAHVEAALREVDAVDGVGDGVGRGGERRVYGDLRAALLRTAAIAQTFGGHGVSSSGRWEEV